MEIGRSESRRKIQIGINSFRDWLDHIRQKIHVLAFFSEGGFDFWEKFFVFFASVLFVEDAVAFVLKIKTSEAVFAAEAIHHVFAVDIVGTPV